MSDRELCIFGEVLFDHFPDGRRVLGGAPFNVAWHLQAFGQNPYFLSRVGDDPEGELIRTAMRDWGMNTAGLETDPALPTGRVEVSFDNGDPRYEIVHPSAWDRIDAGATQTVCDLLYHGSLGLRDAPSRQALGRLMAHRPKSVFVDVNLRPPWWRKAQVLEMLGDADWVKLNADEFVLLHPEGVEGPGAARGFVEEHRLRGLLLTRGPRGAELFMGDGRHLQIEPHGDTKIVDTVGAGDAFAAVMILGLLNDWKMDVTLRRAQAFASGIVGNRGATVENAAFYQKFIEQWRRDA